MLRQQPVTIAGWDRAASVIDGAVARCLAAFCFADSVVAVAANSLTLQLASQPFFHSLSHFFFTVWILPLDSCIGIAWRCM